MANLKVLVFGTERSGTTSMTKVLSELFWTNDCGWSVSHETDEYKFYEAERRRLAKGDPSAIFPLLNRWRHNAEISTNAGMVLPQFRETFGPELKIIYLVRPREEYIKSILRMAERFPDLYGGYAKDGRRGRPTAIDYGLMTENQWQALNPSERFGWWYDHYNQMAQEGLTLFADHLRFETQDLNDPETLEAIQAYINPNWRMDIDPVRMNCQDVFSDGALSAVQRRRLEDFLSDFDWNRLERSPSYLPEYCVNRLAKWYSFANPAPWKRALAKLLIQGAQKFTQLVREDPPK